MTKNHQSEAELLSQLLENVDGKNVHFVVNPDKLIREIRIKQQEIKKEIDCIVQAQVIAIMNGNHDNPFGSQQKELEAEIKRYNDLIQQVVLKCIQ